MTHEIPIVFTSSGVPLAGRFFRNDPSLDTKQPAVVVAGSWLNVKEQMATTYARALAARGLTAFVFDYAGWGESAGPLRHVEMPSAKARDLAAAIDFVASMSFVSNVGALGVCASAQYAMHALSKGAAARALVSVAGWFHDAPSVAPFYGGPAGVALRLGRAREALEHYAKTGEIRMVPAYAPGDDRAGMSFELDYYGNPGRGAVPTWANEMAEMTWLHWLAYDGITPAARVRTPVLMVHSDGCALPDNARRVHALLGGEKELAWLDGTQQDYYDVPAYVERATDLAVAFFERTLR